MDKNKLYESLYNDYQVATTELTHVVNRANEAFDSLSVSKRALAEAKQNLDFAIACALLAEMGEGGRINGKNAEIRALQQKTILAELQDHDGDVAMAAHHVQDLEAEADQYSIEYEQAKNMLSVLRNRARMIAGLANALTG
jgi:phage shock protein A